jgi:hypothetical protein
MRQLLQPGEGWFCTRVAQFAEVQRILVQIRTQMRTDVSVKIPQGVEVVSSVVNAPSTSVVFLNSHGGISESKSSVHIYEPTTGRRFIVPDPDGTSIEEREYLPQPGEVTLLSGAGGALREFQLMGFSLVVITTEGEPL